MSAPVLIDTWHTRAEVAFPDTANLQQTQRSYLWCIKAALLNQLAGGSTSGTRDPGSVWTVAGSSNGVAAGMDGVDRWGATFTPANLVRAAEGSPHSWIVLQSPAALGMWLLLNYNASSEGGAGITLSNVAYTGGTVSAKPTSTNETSVQQATPNSWATQMGVESTFGVTYRFGFSVNQIGEFNWWSNRVATGLFNGFGALRTIKDRHPSDLWPFTGFSENSISGRGAGSSSCFSTSNAAMRTPNLSIRSGVSGWSTPAFGSTAFSSAAPIDVLRNEHIALPIYGYTSDAGQSAWRGRLQDLYVVGLPVVGGSWPTMGAQQYMVVNGLLIPSGVPPTL